MPPVGRRDRSRLQPLGDRHHAGVHPSPAQADRIVAASRQNLEGGFVVTDVARGDLDPGTGVCLVARA